MLHVDDAHHAVAGDHRGGEKGVGPVCAPARCRDALAPGLCSWRWQLQYRTADWLVRGARMIERGFAWPAIPVRAVIRLPGPRPRMDVRLHIEECFVHSNALQS